MTRDEAIEYIKAWLTDEYALNGSDRIVLEMAIEALSEPKTGHWVEIEDYNGDIHYQCDQCGEEFILIDGTPEDNNYWHCPNCGSYNGGGEAVVKGADNESTL